MGTLRTGPDLSNIGYKRGEAWEREHLKFPRRFTPNSIMPSFVYLSDDDLAALVAYLDRLGNKENASTDLMIPVEYENKTQPFSVTKETWDEGRRIYAEKCLSCHGCAGKGDGPYAYTNNARPADLRQPRFQNLDSNFDFWRISEGVPGTVMPQWEQSLSVRERWLVISFIQHAFMDMVPHLTSEGDLPAEYAKAKNTFARNDENIDAGKAIFNMNCAFCHGYGGRGDGPDARGLLPAPPDFQDGQTYNAWTPQDYFWRVSESLPMRAMPQWKHPGSYT
ncbi:MAG: c-type cytochrome, partial [Actinobacteria bacterium]